MEGTPPGPQLIDLRPGESSSESVGASHLAWAEERDLSSGGLPPPDEAGFVALVADQGPHLVRLARAILRDPAQGEDVVQDVLARVLVNWRRVAAADNPHAYVRRMTVNACISWRRRAVRREHLVDSETLELWAGSGRDAYRRVDDRDLLLAALRRLPARQRAVLVLRHFEGLDDAQIAASMGTREVTVRSQAHRGLQTLRTILGASGDGSDAR